MSNYPTTLELFGKKAAGECSPSEYIRWAEGMLLTGKHSPHLAELASLPHNTKDNAYEIGEWFQRSLQELEINIPSEGVALKAHCMLKAQQILNGEIDAYEAIRSFAGLSSSLGHTSLLTGWVVLADDLDGNYNHVLKEFYPYATIFGDKSFATVIKEKTLKFIEELSKIDSLEPKKKKP